MRRVFGGFVLAIAALGAFLYVFDPVAMYHEVEQLAVVPFAAGLLAVLLAVACWGESMRQVSLAAGGHMTPRRGFTAYATGMFAKQILPLGNAGGVPIMAYAIDREADIGFNRSMAVVTIADFFGLLSSLLLATVGVAYVLILFPGTRLLRAGFVFVVVFAVGLLSLSVLLLFRRATLRQVVLGVARLLSGTIGRISARAQARLTPERVGDGVDRYFETFDTVRGNRRSILVAASLALLGWTLFAVPLYTSALAVGASLSFGLVLFVVPVGGIATLVPLPGGLGGVEFAIAGVVVAMTALDLAVVGVMVLLYRACVYWFPVLIGLLSTIYTGTRFRELNPGDSRLADPRERPKR